ncbi:MAG: alpha/beta fold hydrolase [Anaerolineae bacterium]|nr:alpha/beta fold hydrolase [Phycisphaerae bacterium]
MGWIVFLLVFLLVGGLLMTFTAWVIALSLLHPPRMSDGKAMYILRRMSPADIGLTYERVTFDVRDEANRGTDKKLAMAAWWMTNPSANGRCVVMLHGYADAKVGAIAWAPLWHSLGFNILAIDLRAHGESAGLHTTGGHFERHDVEQILDQLRAARPNDVRQIVLLGMSLGSAVALAVAERRPDLATAIVLECPFTSFANATTSHAMRLGSPVKIVMPLALKMAAAISGAKFEDVQPLELMQTLSCPIFVIQSGNDSFVGKEDSDAIANAVGDRANVRLWRAEGAEHLMAIAASPEKYAEQLKAFLAMALTPSPGTPGEGRGEGQAVRSVVGESGPHPASPGVPGGEPEP